MERRGADPTAEWGSSRIPTNGELGVQAAGVRLTEDTALAISAVYTCTSGLANDGSALPLRAYRASGRKRIEIDPPALLQNPWPEGTLQDWLVQVIMSLTVRGNFIGRVCDRDRDGYPLTIEPLHPDEVSCIRNMRTGKREYRYRGQLIPLDDVFHIPGLLMPGEQRALMGLDPLSYMRHSWGLAAAAEQYGGAFFQNSALPGGVIEVAEDLDEDEVLDLARAWSMTHQGIRGSSLPAVLTAGATWKAMAVTPENAQFVATRQPQRGDIGAMYQFPMHRMGVQDRTTNEGVDTESAEIQYCTNGLMPWLTRIENHLSGPTVTRRSTITKFDLSGRLRGNTVARFQALTLGVNGGWLCLDDAREREDMPEIPDGMGKDFYRPLNFATLENIRKGQTAPTSGGNGGDGKVPEGDGGIGGGTEQNPDAPGDGMDPDPGDGSARDAHLAAALEALRLHAAQPPAAPPHVEVHTGDIHVAPAPAAEVRVPITVEQPAPPDIRVDVAAPEVHVDAPVTVNPLLTVQTRAPDVHVNVEPAAAPKPTATRRRVERDRSGNITAVVEEPDAGR